MSKRRGLWSIRKLPSGRYQVRHTAQNGVRRSARITFQSKAISEFELTRIRGKIENGTWFVDESVQAGDLNPKTVTLAELANYWRDKQVTSKGLPLSPKTLPEQPQKLHQGYSVGWPHLVYVGIALYGGAREKTGGISV